MTKDDLVPTTDGPRPVLRTLSISIYGALGSDIPTPGRHDPYQVGQLIACERNGDIAIEHADPHILITSKFLNRIHRGDAQSWAWLRPPREFPRADVPIDASPQQVGRWTGWTVHLHGSNRDLIYLIGQYRLHPIVYEAAWPD